jgi:hypothetical protein
LVEQHAPRRKVWPTSHNMPPTVFLRPKQLRQAFDSSRAFYSNKGEKTGGKTRWWRIESAANPSQAQIPCFRELIRVFARICPLQTALATLQPNTDAVSGLSVLRADQGSHQGSMQGKTSIHLRYPMTAVELLSAHGSTSLFRRDSTQPRRSFPERNTSLT